MDLSGHENLRLEPSRALIVLPSSRLGGVLFGALLASAAVAALPASLVELAIASLGLGEALPFLIPPLGWAPRLLLALSAGIITAALLLIFGKMSPGENRAAPPSERTDRMPLATASSWQRLASFARGGASASAPDSDRRPHDIKWRRKDLHPDAPTPVPLFASRDLPAGVFDAVDSSAPTLELVSSVPVTERQPPFLGIDFDPARPPVRDLSRHDRPRPLPRSPEPLSEEEVEALRALLRAIPEPEPHAPQPVAVQQDPVATPLAGPDAQTSAPPVALPVASDAPLSALLGRFEKSVEERIAIADAQDAALRLDQTLNRSGVPLQAEGQAPVAETVDHALREALEALRVLSAGKRGGGARR